MTHTLTLKISRDVEPREVSDLMGCLWSSLSPWLLNSVTNDESQHIYGRHYVNGDDPREGYEKFSFSYKKYLKAVDKAFKSGTLCCAEDMKDDLGMGCAQDADIVLQFALFNEIVYG
jgi:hypothetical protein